MKRSSVVHGKRTLREFLMMTHTVLFCLNISVEIVYACLTKSVAVKNTYGKWKSPEQVERFFSTQFSLYAIRMVVNFAIMILFFTMALRVSQNLSIDWDSHIARLGPLHEYHVQHQLNTEESYRHG